MMNLYKNINSKKLRSIERDLNVLFSIKNWFIPRSLDDYKEIGIFSTSIRINNNEIYLLENGRPALTRLCSTVYENNIFNSLLNYNDVYQAVLAEIERWLSSEEIPNIMEFINHLDEILSESVSDHFFVCRVDGISLDGVEAIRVGKRELRPYSDQILAGKDTRSEIKSTINDEYQGSFIITGFEVGSDSIAIEKFYYNSELLLSIFRLYSCALSGEAISKINLLLLNNCSNNYGAASCFGWKEPSKNLRFTKYLKKIQSLDIDSELLDYFRKELFFDNLSILIDKENRSELENSIIKSLYWLGEAQKDRSRASAWVKLWSALECFFTLGKDEITESNAKGISSMIVYGGYSHEQYRDYPEVKKKIKKYYKLRSKIVHNAEFSHIEKIQLEDLSYIVAWVIIAIVSLLNRGFSELSQVKNESSRLVRMHEVKN